MESTQARLLLLVLVFFFKLICQTHAQVRITDLPCIERLNQLYCKDPGVQYPAERIDHFIELNKALTLRMFGEASVNDVTPGVFPQNTSSDIQSMHTGVSSSYLSQETSRDRRAAVAKVAPPVDANGTTPDQMVPSPPQIEMMSQHRVDSCESKLELITPFWANNTNNELRVIVNTKHFPQAIQAEICTQETTGFCSGGCICEQKYTYHRLLAYDPANDCKGIYIDWFLYPSCCVCRCIP